MGSHGVYRLRLELVPPEESEVRGERLDTLFTVEFAKEHSGCVKEQAEKMLRRLLETVPELAGKVENP